MSTGRILAALAPAVQATAMAKQGASFSPPAERARMDGVATIPRGILYVPFRRLIILPLATHDQPYPAATSPSPLPCFSARRCNWEFSAVARGGKEGYSSRRYGAQPGPRPDSLVVETALFGLCKGRRSCSAFLFCVCLVVMIEFMCSFLDMILHGGVKACFVSCFLTWLFF